MVVDNVTNTRTCTVGIGILDSLIFLILNLHLDLIFISMSFYENKIHTKKNQPCSKLFQCIWEWDFDCVGTYYMCSKL